MSIKRKKFLALIVAFSLLAASSPLTAAEKRGANVVVMKKNGQEITGELIVARKNTLVLMESETTMTIPMNYDEIAEIIIKKKSQLLIWTVLGTLVLGSAGAAAAYIQGGDVGEPEYGYSAGEKARRGFIIMGVGGLLLGGLIGANKGRNDRIQMVDIPPYKLKIIVSKLNSLARVQEN